MRFFTREADQYKLNLVSIIHAYMGLFVYNNCNNIIYNCIYKFYFTLYNQCNSAKFHLTNLTGGAAPGYMAMQLQCLFSCMTRKHSKEAIINKEERRYHSSLASRAGKKVRNAINVLWACESYSYDYN